MAETGKNFCPSKDGVDNLGKSGKAWGKTYTKELNVSGKADIQKADIQTLRVSGKADIQTLSVSDFTGVLPVAHGGTGTDSLANVTVGKAGTLDGNAGLWDYLHRLGVNPTLPKINATLNELGVFMSYFDQNNKIANQPTPYGQLLNIPADKSFQSTQLWIEQPTGKMFHRGGSSSNAINDTPFKRFLDTDDAQKWKDAYNSLRKRSQPAAFDDDELTALIDTPIGNGSITLSQPYTDFDGLLIDYTADNNNFVSSAYISTAELNRRVAVAKSVNATVIFLFDNRYFWTIYITEAKRFSPTFFPYEDDNCIIQQIYGVKFKETT